MNTAKPSTDDIGGADGNAMPEFTVFGDAAAGFCGDDMCAIPQALPSADADEPYSTVLPGTGN